MTNKPTSAEEQTKFNEMVKEFMITYETKVREVVNQELEAYSTGVAEGVSKALSEIELNYALTKN